jgi:hypothetical protein
MKFPTFDKQEDIPEAFRGSYVKSDDGKWNVDDSDSKGLKDSQRRLLDEKKTADTELERLKKIFGTRKPEDVEKLLKDADSSDDDKHRKAGDIDKLIEKRVNEIRAELDPQVQAGKAAQARLDEIQFGEDVWAAAKAAGALDSDKRSILKVAKDDYVRKGKDGKLMVVDADGDPTGEDLPKLFSGRFKKEFPKFYNATVGSGGGANGGTGSGSRGTDSGKVTITDEKGFLANIDKIAKGEVKAEVVAE